MQAVIMAGGYGTRLRPLTNRIPKPMVPIIDKPLIGYLVEHLREQGIKDIILTLGYKPEVILDYLGDGKRYGVNIRYVIEREPLGTAGGVKNVSDMLEDTFLVLSGDAFTNIEVDAMLDYHYVKGGLLTMAVKKMDDVKEYGVVKLNENNKVVDFVEKPLVSREKCVNTGIYILEPEVLDIIPNNEKYDFARDLFPRIIDNMYGYEMQGYWSDIGTLSSYYLTNNYVALHPEPFGCVWA